MSVPFLDVAAACRELAEPIGAAIARVVASGRFVLGPELEGFERDLAGFCGVAHAVGVASGLDALELTLRAWDVGAGDEVIVPAHTFVATWIAVVACGARPVAVDVDPGTFNLDPARLEGALSARTRAIVPVHLYGQAADMDAIAEVARRRRLLVLEDAAQALGARWRGRRAGSLGDAAAFSFYPAKNLGALGDAGAVVTDDADLAARLRDLRNYGGREKYVHREIGRNSRLDELQAAVLRAKLPHLEAWNERRRRIAGAYLASLAGAAVTLPATAAGAEPVWHLFVVRHRERDRLRAELAAAGVATLVHYPTPPHLTPALRALGHRRGDFPITEQIASTALSLPIGPHLDDEAVARVIAAVRAAG